MRPMTLLLAALLAVPTGLALDLPFTTQTLPIRITGTTGAPDDVDVTLPGASQASCSTRRVVSVGFFTDLTVTVTCTLLQRDCTQLQVTATHPLDEFPQHETGTFVEGACGDDARCYAIEGTSCAGASAALQTEAARRYVCVASPRWVAQTDVRAEWRAACSLRVV